MNEFTEVSRLFQEESDLQALELLYKLTDDELVNILISWYNDYEDIRDYGETNEFYMYDDIIHYLYITYGL